MSQDATAPVTILIPHFQTLDSIKLCLRSLRKFTRRPYIARVLDNGSCDASLEYLRSLTWIELIHTSGINDIWKAHYTALNAALPQVTTPYFLLMHSDTYVHHPQWLDVLLGFARAGYAAVGPRHQRVPTRTWSWLLPAALQHLRVRERTPGEPELRSFCALYATEPFRQAGGQFVTEHGEDVNFQANRALIRAGHRICGLSAFALSPYIFHASAVTLIAQGTPPVPRHQTHAACQRGTSYLDHRIFRRSQRVLNRFLMRAATREILADDSLDK